MKLLVLFSLSLILAQANCSPNTTGDTSTQTITTSKSKDKGVIKLEDYIKKHQLEQYEVAILAGGCFWCTEAVYERIAGVVDVVSGYCGGGLEIKPSYELTGKGTTTFAESIAVFYDKEVINFDTLLDVFFIAHDPTTLNSQGPDFGPEYRSTIFYQSEEEKSISETVISSVNDSGRYSDPVVTTLELYDLFWTAEDYHQNYYELNPNHGYVLRVSKPKVDKVVKEVPELLKTQYRK